MEPEPVRERFAKIAKVTSQAPRRYAGAPLDIDCIVSLQLINRGQHSSVALLCCNTAL
jgi:hypothetical protein